MTVYNIAVVYAKSRPMMNPHLKDMPYVVTGDIIAKYTVEARSKPDALMEARDLWNQPDPEMQVFKNKADILFFCTLKS